jgi:hypothetical protein
LKRKKIAENRKHSSIRTNQKQAEERAKTRCKNKAATSETETEPLPTQTLKKEALGEKKRFMYKNAQKFRRGRWRKDKRSREKLGKEEN